jgi:hypothetical protein
MIHYHGCPITPETVAHSVLTGRHAMVSFANPNQIELVSEVCHSFCLDNGAFSAWKSGNPIIDWKPYYQWVRELSKKPNFDWALIPDIIDGSEKDNDVQIAIWPLGKQIGVPIWHLHESLQKLYRLCEYWPRVAFGSSGDFAQIGTPAWWQRMYAAFDTICPFGYPMARLHGLRMLDPGVFTKFPFTSCDSTNVAQNIGIDSKWKGTYLPPNKAIRGLVLASRIETFQSAPHWEKSDG